MKIIKKLKLLAEKMLERVERQGETVKFSAWLGFFSVLIAVRILITNITQKFSGESASYLINFYFQDFFFFFLVLILIWIWLSLFLRVHPQKLMGLMLWGSWLVILPPIIDLVFFHTIFWSFYLINDIHGLWAEYYSFFGHLPPAIVYFGAKIACLIAVLATSLVVYLKTQKIWNALVNGWAVYSIFFFLASFPSWLTFFKRGLFEGKNIFSISIADIASFSASPAQIFGINHEFLNTALMFKLNLIYFILSILLSLILWSIWSKENFKSFFRQAILEKKIILPLLMVAIGIGLFSSKAYPGNMEIDFFSVIGLAVIFLSLFCSTLADTLFAKNKEAKREIIMLNLIALTGLLLLNAKLFLFLLMYKILLVVFLNGPFAFLRSKIAAVIVCWGSMLMSFTLGFMLVSDNQRLVSFPGKMAIWLTLGTAVIFGFFTKDSSVDEKGKTGNKSWTIATSILIFLLFMAGFWVAPKASIFQAAILLGGASFWIVEKKVHEKSHILKILYVIFAVLVYYAQ